MEFGLEKSIFKNLEINNWCYKNEEYLNIIDEINDFYNSEWEDEDGENDTVGTYEYRISFLEEILERVTDEYENMKVNVEINIKKCYWEDPIDMYWQGIYGALEQLIDEKDVEIVFNEICQFTETYSQLKLTINDLTPLTQKMIKELEIENNVRWDREYILCWEGILDNPLYELKLINEIVCNKLKKRINEEKESLKNIIDIFLF